MRFLSHRAIVNCIFDVFLERKFKFDHNLMNLVINYSTFPDYVGDITIDINGKILHSFLNNNLCSLTHFGRTVGNKKIVGYCFGHDGSITKFKKPNVAKIIIDNSKWEEFINFKKNRHPMDDLLNVPGYTDDLFKITFVSCVTMANWIINNHKKDDESFAKAIGCVCHIITDASIFHHNRAVLFGGHSEFEKKIDDMINWALPKRIIHDIVENEFENIELRDKTIREIIEKQCESTGAFSSADEMWAIRMAIRSTIKLLLMCNWAGHNNTPTLPIPPPILIEERTKT